ncbi:MAG: pyrimidine-nucleoside phosphorylase [Lachnospiraceae bacterium]|nr:pyrimidine-nucleoside phosphorylase [Lachnospiraceae bacterium]
MRMYDLIEKKKQGKELTKEEIDYIISEYSLNEIPDYQMSAFLMAVYFKGMTMDETVNLTMAMANSGDTLDLSAIDGIKVDKHSTGGVGDKTSLIVAPMLASLGVPIAKMSGRGLGHTGGTIDKLESFRGFKTSLSEEAFIKQVNDIKLALVGQTANLAPADKKIYALRDVTATVNQKSLIASSIMSKKIAAGADSIILDVKCGSGAFMENLKDAEELARIMVSIGEMVGRQTVAIISDMNEPLGHYVGNALEVYEAIEVLSGRGEERLKELCITIASYMLIGGKKAESFEDAREKMERVIREGKALDKLAEFVNAQGGDMNQVYHPDQLPKAMYRKELLAPNEGYLTACKTSEVGMASLILGGGRETKESEIDLSVGIRMDKKLGDHVDKGEVMGVIFANDADLFKPAYDRLINAYTISEKLQEPEALIKKVITRKDVMV